MRCRTESWNEYVHTIGGDLVDTLRDEAVITANNCEPVYGDKWLGIVAAAESDSFENATRRKISFAKRPGGDLTISRLAEILNDGRLAEGPPVA